MKKVLIRISEEQAKQIEQIAEKIKVSANDVYKFAIYDFIEKHRMF